MRKKLHVLLRLFLMSVLVTTLTHFSLHAQETIRIDVSEDAMIRGGSKSSNNWGDADYMQIALGEGSNEHAAFLKFDLSALSDVDPAKILSATLNLHASNFNPKWGAPDGGETKTTQWVTYVQDDTWAEATLTYDNKPAHSDSIAGVMTKHFNDTTKVLLHTIDILNAVKAEADNVLSLRLHSTCNYDNEADPRTKAQYHTKEKTIDGEALGSYIEVVYSSADMIIDVAEDGMVRGGSKSTKNWGSADYMQISQGDGSNEHIAFLKYDLSDISDLSKVQSATLHLNAFNANPKWGDPEGGSSSSTQWVTYVQDDLWEEATLTYDNKPADSDSIAGVETTATANETDMLDHAIDITPAVKRESDKILSLQVHTTLQYMTDPKTKAQYHTKEKGESFGSYIEIVMETTSVKQFVDSKSISVYPNPASDFLTISSTNSGIDKVEIYGLAGQLIKNWNHLNGVKTVHLPVEELQAGSYVIRAFVSDGSVVSNKLLKK